jgi:S-adenosylmethionine:diacylglycerol 3-amino-3-carboxypropyl transferase
MKMLSVIAVLSLSFASLCQAEISNPAKDGIFKIKSCSRTLSDSYTEERLARSLFLADAEEKCAKETGSAEYQVISKRVTVMSSGACVLAYIRCTPSEE